jgi:hypothetical protein
MKKNIDTALHSYAGIRQPYALIMFLLFVTLTTVSCDDFLEVAPPNSQLYSGNVFEEKTTANAAMADIYSKMRDAGMLTGYSSGISHLMAIYTDEMQYYGTAEDDAQLFYNNSLLPSGYGITSWWNDSYNQVFAANALILGVENAASLSSSDKSQLKGEALFVRSIVHFYLTNLYGHIPYITTTEYIQNSHATKLPPGEVYALCMDDLQEAIALLPSDYVTAERTRPNKFAAQALLARVALYAGNNALAINAASAVLENTALYPGPGNVETMFLKESLSTIWQFSPGFDGSNTIEATTFIFEFGPPYISALSNDLVNAFPEGDLRRQYWINEVSDGETTWYHPYKYKVIYAMPASEYSVILRLGELYLIRAEARARTGDLEGAKEDVNRISNTAGSPNTTAATQEEILLEILEQRRLELFSEFGHRFFDLKRFGKLNEVLSPKPGWDTNDALLPLPENELLLNPSLAPQNPGY